MDPVLAQDARNIRWVYFNKFFVVTEDRNLKLKFYIKQLPLSISVAFSFRKCSYTSFRILADSYWRHWKNLNLGIFLCQLDFYGNFPPVIERRTKWTWRMFLFDSMSGFFLQRYNPVASDASAPSSAEKIKRTHRRTNNFIQMVNLERHLVAV